MSDSVAALSELGRLREELSGLLRMEEIRLLRKKELLLVVLEGQTGSRRVERRAVDLALLHTQTALTSEVQALASAVS